MGRRIARAAIPINTTPWSRRVRYEYIVLDEGPDTALTHANPPFPGNAYPGTYLWTFVPDLDAGGVEQEDPSARPYGVVLMEPELDYLIPGTNAGTSVALTFETSPRFGLGDSLQPVVRWNVKGNLESVTEYVTNSGRKIESGFQKFAPTDFIYATIDSSFLTVAMYDYKGTVNKNPFYGYPARSVMYVVPDSELFHGQSADYGTGKARVTLEFQYRRLGWDYREVRRNAAGEVEFGPDGQPLYDYDEIYAETDFADLFTGLDVGGAQI